MSSAKINEGSQTSIKYLMKDLKPFNFEFLYFLGFVVLSENIWIDLSLQALNGSIYFEKIYNISPF